MGAAVLASLAADTFAQRGDPPTQQNWDSGQVRHLLPTVSDTKMLIKTSFNQALTTAPTLHVGATAFRGRRNDTEGSFWEFYATGLQPSRRYTLSLTGAGGRSLCQPWDLSTFPAPDARPESLGVLFFTCAGGPDGDGGTDANGVGGYLPTAIRSRLMRRALSFQPQAMVANGDHVYWDLHAPRVPAARRDNTRLQSFNRSALVFGDRNETVLKLAAGPQIVPVYGTDFRSIPVFFLQDDHDYDDNDEAFEEIVTFPPIWFQLELARATQRLYYPEFLPTRTGRAVCRGVPWEMVRSRRVGALSDLAVWPRYFYMMCAGLVHSRA
jgi:hypothetical protein